MPCQRLPTSEPQSWDVNIGLAGAKALPLALWLPREVGRTWAQEINFINKTQREGAGGTGPGLLPPGVSHINNLLPGHREGGMRGQKVTAEKDLPEGHRPQPTLSGSQPLLLLLQIL